jgi:hypothetical protein
MNGVIAFAKFVPQGKSATICQFRLFQRTLLAF